MARSLAMDSFLPVMSPETQAFIRAAYGVLLFLVLLLTLPPSRWFFCSEKWGGYAESGPTVDWIQNPFVRPLVMGLWFVCASRLMVGQQTVIFAALNLALCWYFFIHMRWRGILRGMGAPGFMTYWMGACILFLEVGRHLDPSGRLLPVALLAFQVDYALIQMCSGAYKLSSGYARNEGQQLGLVNPWWGYHWKRYRELDYHHPVFKFLNHSAYLTQVGAALLMLNPSTRLLGAAMIMGSFVFILTQIRLGVLCEMVIVGGLLFVAAGGTVDRFLSSFGANPNPVQSLPDLPDVLVTALVVFFWTYIVALPFAKLGQWYNFLARKSLPQPFQTVLERWTNLFGIIIWRVFSVDVVNFFVKAWIQDPATGEESEYTCFGRLDWETRFRYIHVGEFVCFASLFTTLKYHPSNSDLFQKKLVRYARTIPCPTGGRVRFEYFSILPGEERFQYLHRVDYVVDPEAGTLQERIVDPDFDPRAAAATSPVHEGARPGSYAPRSG